MDYADAHSDDRLIMRLWEYKAVVTLPSSVECILHFDGAILVHVMQSTHKNIHRSDTKLSKAAISPLLRLLGFNGTFSL